MRNQPIQKILMKMSRLKILLPFFFCLISIAVYSNVKDKEPIILVFTKTSAFVHDAIADGVAAIQLLGNKNGFKVDTTSNAALFSENTLKQYKAIVFLNTTGNVLNVKEEKAFEQFIENGGGFVGIHAASDTEYEWEWYGKMVGAYFESHPDQQEANLIVIDKKHPATAHLPNNWLRKDEWYNFKNLNASVKVLIQLDEKSYQGGKNGLQHPIAWYHYYEGGRAFYTGLGHTKQSYKEANFLQHLLGGIHFAIGLKK